MAEQLYRLHYAIPTYIEIVIYVMSFVVVANSFVSWASQAVKRLRTKRVA